MADFYYIIQRNTLIEGKSLNKSGNNSSYNPTVPSVSPRQGTSKPSLQAPFNQQLDLYSW